MPTDDMTTPRYTSRKGGVPVRTALTRGSGAGHLVVFLRQFLSS